VYRDPGGGAWEKTFLVEGERQFDKCGSAVALDSTGTRLAVGCAGGYGWLNAVRTYEATDGSWKPYGGEYIYEVPGEEYGRNSFGCSVALNAAGDRLVVGAESYSVTGEIFGIGKLSVFALPAAGNWTPVASATGTDGNTFLGRAALISRDGYRIAGSLPARYDTNSIFGFDFSIKGFGGVSVFDEDEQGSDGASTPLPKTLAILLAAAALLLA